MNGPNYPAERIARYAAAIAGADTYAQLGRADDHERFALAVMAVADAETDPAYKSGYDTGRMHAGAPAETTIYRASHPDAGITLGLYTTATEARAHCVAEERRAWTKGEPLVFDWIEDEEDGVAKLVTVTEDGGTESVTGYVVTALTVASKYDEEADA